MTQPALPPAPAAEPPRNRRRKSPPPTTDRRLLSQPEAWAYIGLSRSAWFRLRAEGHAPKAVRLPGSSRPRWRQADLDRWLAGLPAKKN